MRDLSIWPSLEVSRLVDRKRKVDPPLLDGQAFGPWFVLDAFGWKMEGEEVVFFRRQLWYRDCRGRIGADREDGFKRRASAIEDGDERGDEIMRKRIGRSKSV